ncbi:LapA family protein [Thiobacillus sedimenti]|uniref:LapA family protein n=1 Tax=Thiobacillus sedimenti TaxID=3110231 RepID=A0ABZ1CLD9_9PROT|nr:LapA family protein [Thiobacillus sp. SCUT-2]WRS40199.1 LapA family protein [Thiobacillus sp. SCUT-2]
MKNLTRYLGLALKLLVFLLVLGFALKNSHTVTFYSYLGYVWQAPLIVMLGLAFVIGALFGLAALLPTVFRQRREIARRPLPEEAETTMQTDLLPPHHGI